MRIRILSDLHLEHAPFQPPAADADVVVLAGDTAPGTAGIEWTRTHFPGVPVLYVAGNHEFYGDDFPGLIGRLRAAAAASTADATAEATTRATAEATADAATRATAAATNIHVLERDQITIGDVRFLGCSLWSDFDFAGAEQREHSMRVCERVVNDYRQIRFTHEHRPLRAADTRATHLESRAWLAARLAEHHDGPTVVITHHAPLVRRAPQDPTLAAVGGAFATDLSTLMDGAAVDLWIFGHIHRTVDVDVNGTRVLSNQRGYPHEPVVGFDPALVVEL